MLDIEIFLLPICFKLEKVGNESLLRIASSQIYETIIGKRPNHTSHQVPLPFFFFFFKGALEKPISPNCSMKGGKKSGGTRPGGVPFLKSPPHPPEQCYIYITGYQSVWADSWLNENGKDWGSESFCVSSRFQMWWIQGADVREGRRPWGMYMYLRSDRDLGRWERQCGRARLENPSSIGLALARFSQPPASIKKAALLMQKTDLLGHFRDIKWTEPTQN